MLHTLSYPMMQPRTNKFWQPWLSSDTECARPCGPNKELPTVRWRHDRREKHSAGYTKHRSYVTDRAADTPLDMTTPRGLPPPYSQCVGSRGLKSARPSVITCARKSPTSFAPSSRTEQLSDPVIDEHFRRSLGNDYMNLFAGSEEKATNGSSVTVTGLSVDDHFAKALGDTWVRLQKDSESSTKSEDSPPSSASSEPPTPSPEKTSETTSPPSPTTAPATTTTTTSSTSPPATTKRATSPSLVQPRRGLVSI